MHDARLETMGMRGNAFGLKASDSSCNDALNPHPNLPPARGKEPEGLCGNVSEYRTLSRAAAA